MVPSHLSRAVCNELLDKPNRTPRCSPLAPAERAVSVGEVKLSEIIPWARSDNSWDLDAPNKKMLASRGFDVALCSNTLHHYPDLILATTLGIPNRFGFAHKGLSALITHKVPMNFPSPFPAYFRTLVGEVIEKNPD